VLTFAAVLFANAEPTDLSASAWLLILECCGVILGVVALVLVPVEIAAGRRSEQREVVNSLAFWWGLVAAWSAVSLTIAEFNWKKEWLLRIMTGYLDPGDTTGAPQWPWRLWTILTILYAALLVFVLASGVRGRSEVASARRDARVD
jgi:hypothetical protein